MQHITTSKGRRDKKRKRKDSAIKASPSQAPPLPEIQSYIDVGLSAVTRGLQESVVAKARAKTRSEGLATGECPACCYSAIFVARSGHPNALNVHLPQMVAVASKSHPEHIPIRLVGFSKPCEERLSEALGIRRISCIGIHHNAPNSNPLVDFIREHVPAIDLQWLQEARQAEHRETKINSIETTIGSKKQATSR